MGSIKRRLKQTLFPSWVALERDSTRAMEELQEQCTVMRARVAELGEQLREERAGRADIAEAAGRRVREERAATTRAMGARLREERANAKGALDRQDGRIQEMSERIRDMRAPSERESELRDSLAEVTRRTDEIKNENEALRARLAELGESYRSQRQVSASLQADSTRNRTALMMERIETFFSGTELTLPPGPFAEFERRVREASPERADAFLESLAKDGYRPLFEQLFLPEMAMAQGFNFDSLQSIVTFQRGAQDIAQAEARGLSLDELKANHIRITRERFDALIGDDMIDAARVEGVCEIGAAWGAGTRYMIGRYAPERYHVYEIDTAWAQWLADNLGVDSKNCDGETLAHTDDDSMDICLATSCLYYMPWLKQWKYLAEFARVLRPGGLAVFNVNLMEDTTLRTLEGLRTNYFPRRVFGYIPRHCLDTAFPDDAFERIVEPTVANHGYQVIRKRG